MRLDRQSLIAASGTHWPRSLLEHCGGCNLACTSLGPQGASPATHTHRSPINPLAVPMAGVFQSYSSRDFPGDLVVNSPCNAGYVGLSRGGGAKIPHAAEQLSLQATTRESLHAILNTHHSPKKKKKHYKKNKAIAPVGNPACHLPPHPPLTPPPAPSFCPPRPGPLSPAPLPPARPPVGSAQELALKAPGAGPVPLCSEPFLSSTS